MSSKLQKPNKKKESVSIGLICGIAAMMIIFSITFYYTRTRRVTSQNYSMSYDEDNYTTSNKPVFVLTDSGLQVRYPIPNDDGFRDFSMSLYKRLHIKPIEQSDVESIYCGIKKKDKLLSNDISTLVIFLHRFMTEYPNREFIPEIIKDDIEQDASHIQSLNSIINKLQEEDPYLSIPEPDKTSLKDLRHFFNESPGNNETMLDKLAVLVSGVQERERLLRQQAEFLQHKDEQIGSRDIKIAQLENEDTFRSWLSLILTIAFGLISMIVSYVFYFLSKRNSGSPVETLEN